MCAGYDIVLVLREQFYVGAPVSM